MKYILGIDTTFHTSAVGLVAADGRVLSNEKIDINFNNENAEKFFNFHTENIISLLKPILEKYLNDIFLIGATNKEGAFHSMPVGVIIASVLSHFWNKPLVGVDHEISHIYANWLERDSSDFVFPIVVLNISGAHSDIRLMKNHHDIVKISDIFWHDSEVKFGGLGVLFGSACYYLLNIKVNRGEGAAYLEKLAQGGQPKYYKNLNLEVQKENGNYKFKNSFPYLKKQIKELGYFALGLEERLQFQKDFACSLYEAVFDSLVKILSDAITGFGFAEIHLSGGVAANRMLNGKLDDFCKKNRFIFKSPARLDFCGDNAAAVAIAGYYKWDLLTIAEKEKNRFIKIEPSQWYYKYYFNQFFKD